MVKREGVGKIKWKEKEVRINVKVGRKEE